MNILSGEVAAPDDVKFRFAFLDPKESSFPQVKFKDLVFSSKDVATAAMDLIAKAGRELTDAERGKVSRHVGLVFKAFHSDDGIAYQELDSIENEELYTEDDVVEVFIRANSGGTKLGKSDLLFSLLTSSWDDADEKMSVLLDQLNKPGFAFTRDFMLKTCLTLLGHGSRYEVSKFRRKGVREEIEEKWDDIAKATFAVADFVRGSTFIRCDKALPSYLVLIPLIYLRYHFPKPWKDAKDVDSYLLRTLLAGTFGLAPDQLIDDLVNKIKEIGRFDATEMFGVIRSKNRGLELTEDRLWAMGYGSDNVHLLFNLWYRQFNYTPAFANNFPQIDHIFPQSALKKIKRKNETTGRMDVMRYPEAERNRLANCMLLTAEENGAGGKSDTPPSDWFSGDRSKDAYLDMHLIPKDSNLWTIDRFEDFLLAREALIRDKFKYLLIPSSSRPIPEIA